MTTEITRIQDREWYKRFHRSEFLNSHNNAMFKGIPFIFVDDSFNSGRRIARHEFPQRDVPYSEDLGRRIRTIEIQGELLGDDYLTQKDNLLVVCEEGGSGELIHPYYGILNVECDKVTITNRRSETRICQFQATFTEKGVLEFPIISTDTTTSTLLQTEKVIETSENFFVGLYNSTIKLISAIDGKRVMLKKAFLEIEIAKSKAKTPADFKKKIDEYIAAVPALVNDSEALFDSVLEMIIYGILGVFQDETIDSRDSFNGLKGTLDFSPDIRESSDDSDAIKDIVQYNTLATMAYLVSIIDFENTNEVEDFRKTLLDKIDELVLVITSDDLNQDLRDLRKVIVEDTDVRSLNLPTITSYIPLKTIPALVISYTLYGNVTNEQDIIDRNNLYTFNFAGEPVTENILGIQHPGFVPGGEELEVLLNV